MKAELLATLRDADDYVSGQDLCTKFGVSRTAVWKAVNQLKEAGYEIEAVQNKGYRLIGVPDRLSEEELQSIRKTQWAGSEILYFPVIDSTNTKAKQLGEEGYPNGTLVVAEQQDAGRGRRGRSFESPRGSGIFMTLLLKPDLNPNNASMITLVAALAVSKAITNQTGRPAGIKWPNDIVMNGKKAVGILTEMSAQFDYVNHIVVGIGINVHNESFPEELKDIATSLYMETGEHYNRAAMIEEVLEQFEYYYEIFLKTEDLSGLVNEYNAHLLNMHQIVKVLDPREPFEGKAMGITARGELIVDTWESRKLVSAGEVSVRGIYGYV
jgi:BirA family biotin operon repressor/biotin-[acetyl-CoA-carboxylase] ligase